MKLNVLIVTTALLMSAGLSPGVETVLDVNMKSKVKLPISGEGVRQVSGIRTAPAGDGTLTAPGEVCTLIYARGDDRAVVRVWEDKAHRVFVSTARGDDAGDGSEARPFKTIQRAIDWVLKNDKDKNADVYIAGGDYNLGESRVTVTFKISLYGGFYEAGWRRDPAVHQSVLLPKGFRAGWVDDMCDRFKDLRRARPRYRQTRLRKTYRKRGSIVLDIGTRGSERLETTGTKDTYIDGLVVHGTDVTGLGEPTPVYVSSINDRTIRNCIFFSGYSGGHAFMPGAGGRGLWTNNILWGGIVGTRGHARPQTVFRSGATVSKCLHVGATGGDYTRMFLCWGRGGTVEDSQIHGGNSFDWSTMMQGHHGGMNSPTDYVFSGNTVMTDFVGQPCLLSGLVCKGNTFYLRRAGFTALLTTRTLKIAGNTFYCMARANKDNVFPTGKSMTRRLGGKFGGSGTRRVLEQPAGNDAAKPVIKGNRFEQIEDIGRRPPNSVDIRKLKALIKTDGQAVCLRPKSPATDLVAKAEAGAVKLTWKPSKAPRVVGYRIYYGPETNSYANTLVVTGKTSAEIKGLKPGRWHFSVAAHKEAFVECWTLSNEVEVSVGQ